VTVNSLERDSEIAIAIENEGEIAIENESEIAIDIDIENVIVLDTVSNFEGPNPDQVGSTVGGGAPSAITAKRPRVALAGATTGDRGGGFDARHSCFFGGFDPSGATELRTYRSFF
jgi:hypothetical protein